MRLRVVPVHADTAASEQHGQSLHLLAVQLFLLQVGCARTVTHVEIHLVLEIAEQLGELGASAG